MHSADGTQTQGLQQKNRAKQAGFTLIELLIAISITAVLSVLGYQAIQQVVAVKSHSDQSLKGFNHLERLLWWLEQDLTQMAPRTVPDGLDGILPALISREGSGIEFSRLSDYPSPYGQGGVTRVGYLLDDQVLYRLVWPVIDRVSDTEPRKIILLEGVLSFEVKLLNSKGSWQTEWPNETEQTNTMLPLMSEVLIEVEGLGEARRLFPGVEGVPAEEESKNKEDSQNP